MNFYSLLAWIFFYILVVTLFYWCFRQSMENVVQNSATTNTTNNEAMARSGASDIHLSGRVNNERRMAYTVAHGRNVYLITESNRPSNSSDLSPPEYKWEDLPPTYEEAVATFTNPAVDGHPSSPDNGPNEVVIELPATAASVN